MSTHIFVHLSPINHGCWFRLNLEPDQIPRSIRELAATIMKTPDHATIVKDRNGIFTYHKASSVEDVESYVRQFVNYKRSASWALPQPTSEAQTQ